MHCPLQGVDDLALPHCCRSWTITRWTALHCSRPRLLGRSISQQGALPSSAISCHRSGCSLLARTVLQVLSVLPQAALLELGQLEAPTGQPKQLQFWLGLPHPCACVWFHTARVAPSLLVLPVLHATCREWWA